MDPKLGNIVIQSVEYAQGLQVVNGYREEIERDGDSNQLHILWVD